MLDQEKILNLIKSTGPILPSKVSKTIKTDILLASAHLADLVSQGKVRISKLKVGGSPLYYLLGQEDQLYPFAAGNINPKDQRVLEILKSNRVLREDDLDLLSKVALRSLKRFNRSLSELSATFNYLGVNFLELFKISDAKVKKHGKKWIRSEMDLKETSSKDVASVSDSLQNIKENP